MDTNQLKSTGFIFRIAGNLVLAVSLGTYLLIMGEPNPPFPEWVPIAFAILGCGLLVTAMLVRAVPPNEEEIRREFEREERRRETDTREASAREQ